MKYSCLRDDDGFYWITGRLDDMMNVSGHLLSSAEIESAVSSHPSVAEAAVGYDYTPQLVEEIKCKVRGKIGPVAVPEVFQKADSLPKTRSGKIMRRILRGVADGKTDRFGDLTSLAEEHVVQDLINNRHILPDK
ncbi:hypothetical protein M514_09462 [Trichuris suis]|uniref:AMP-binding enzyme C-terminal domain-containing protein n=1 Tax=Trichuris suis TaxID=68888 RepID=A0A085N9Y3_9BILA|nr:hypothetical protein M514_09462 [Trichuris suis]